MYNYLISYPRSGSTWIRYCIEYLTEAATLGWMNFCPTPEIINQLSNLDVSGLPAHYFESTGVILDEEKLNKLPILTKRHNHEDIKTDINSLLLLVRDYKECVERQSSKELRISIKKTNYLDLIRFYDRFEGKKDIIYYEDIIKDVKSCIIKSLDLLEHKIEGSKLDEFMHNIDSHHAKCMSLYKDSDTDGKTISRNKDAHTVDYYKECERYISENHSDISKYLERYYV